MTNNQIIRLADRFAPSNPPDRPPCWRCHDQQEIVGTKDDVHEFIIFHAIRHGWKVALSVWHDWKHRGFVPCSECEVL